MFCYQNREERTGELTPNLSLTGLFVYDQKYVTVNGFPIKDQLSSYTELYSSLRSHVMIKSPSVYYKLCIKTSP